MIKEKSRLVLIATPCKGSLPLHYVAALLAHVQQEPGPITFGWTASTTGSIAICRDILAEQFLGQPEAQGVLMIDADMRWTPEHVVRICSHNLPLVGGVYARKETPARWVMTGIPGKTKPDANGLIQVHEIGTGFLYIGREVFLAMQEKLKNSTNPEIMHLHKEADGTLSERYNYFWQGVAERRFHGEDYGFCYLARKCGFEIFADTQCLIPHHGDADFPLHDKKEIPIPEPEPIRGEPQRPAGFVY